MGSSCSPEPLGQPGLLERRPRGQPMTVRTRVSHAGLCWDLIFSHPVSALFGAHFSFPVEAALK